MAVPHSGLAPERYREDENNQGDSEEDLGHARILPLPAPGGKGWIAQPLTAGLDLQNLRIQR
jgi:hypothetical protein